DSIAQELAKAETLRVALDAEQTARNEILTQLELERKNFKNLERDMLTLNELRQKLPIIVAQIFSLDPRYPFERALTRKVGKQIEKLQELSQHRYNHSIGQQSIIEVIQKTSYPMEKDRLYAYLNKALADTALYYKDLNPAGVITTSDPNKLLLYLTTANEENKKQTSNLYTKLTNNIKSLHQLRLQILDNTPGLVTSTSLLPSTSSSSSASTELTNSERSNLEYQSDHISLLFPIYVEKLRELFKPGMKPVTVDEIAGCFSFVLEDLEVEEVLKCLNIGGDGNGGSGSGSGSGLGDDLSESLPPPAYNEL
ncbi:hypothetical protein HDU76_005398, partial [Blyttiomyces sp. JEL0837]